MQKIGDQSINLFCPSVFLFLCAVVPAIWFLQLHVCKLRIQESESRKENMTRCEIESNVGEQADFEFGDIKVDINC
uniref:Uncharacterized protein n=1 Tax=Romanomermis culicivorax TaxID=13658 RepID=A0A915J3B1_ROMCU